MSKLTKQLKKIDALIEKHHEIIRSLHDLKASLAHEAQHDSTYCTPRTSAEAEPATKAKYRPELAISRDDLIVLKRMYDAAMAGNREQFEFKGQVLLTQYAKYVIEYTESGFDSTRR